MAEHENSQGATGGGAPEGATASTGGVGSWILGIFVDPKSTFEQVNDAVERPHPGDASKTKDMSKWWLPVLITIVVVIGISLYTVPKFVAPMQADAIREMVVERGGTAADAEQAIRMSSAMLLPGTIIGATVVTFIMLFVFAGVSHLVMKMAGGKGRFRNARAVVAWGMLVTALGSIVKLPLMIVKGSALVETGPTLFFRSLEPSDRLYRFLSSLDIFTIWWLVLLVVGLSIGYRSSKGKAVVAGVVVWVLYMLLVTFSPGGIGASM